MEDREWRERRHKGAAEPLLGMSPQEGSWLPPRLTGTSVGARGQGPACATPHWGSETYGQEVGRPRWGISELGGPSQILLVACRKPCSGSCSLAGGLGGGWLATFISPKQPHVGNPQGEGFIPGRLRGRTSCCSPERALGPFRLTNDFRAVTTCVCLSGSRPGLNADHRDWVSCKPSPPPPRAKCL